MRLLFQIATGQDFIFKAEALEREMIACGYFGTFLVTPYMIVFYITSVYIFVNLFIAMLLENFELNFDPDALDVKQSDLEAFKAAWAVHAPTPQATRIPIQSCKGLVGSLKGVLAETMLDKLWWNKLLIRLDWNIEDPLTEHNTVGFHQLLVALTLGHFSIEALPLEEKVQAASELKTREQATAQRLICSVAVARARIKHPERFVPAGMEQYASQNPAEFAQKFRLSAVFARDLMIMQICKVSKTGGVTLDDSLGELVSMQEGSNIRKKQHLLDTNIAARNTTKRRLRSNQHKSSDAAPTSIKVTNPMAEIIDDD